MRRSAIFVLVIVVGGVGLVSGSTACDALTASTCHVTNRAAAERILTPWCERYVECDPTRGTASNCVSVRIAIAAVPDETGCAASCSEDTDCHRSTCVEDRITKCATDSKAMACADQVNGMLIQLPSSCDSCYR